MEEALLHYNLSLCIVAWAKKKLNNDIKMKCLVPEVETNSVVWPPFPSGRDKKVRLHDLCHKEYPMLLRKFAL
jgi:hypothetical protein